MHILHTVEFYHPGKGGAQEVVRQISEQLVRRGHQVTVATTRLKERTTYLVNGVCVEEFDISGNAALGFKGETGRYQQFLRAGAFDVMMNYAAQEWTADLAYPLLDELPFGRVLVPCGFSGLYQPLYQEYYRAMPGILRRYDALIFHATQYRDIDFARQHDVQHCTIIPNGALQSEFDVRQPSFRQRYQIAEDVSLLLTVGSHTGYKGHDVAIEAFRKAKCGPAVLVVIGNMMGSKGCLRECQVRSARANILGAGKKRVLLLDLPRPEVVAAYQAADLFVFPSNIEYSPLVLFEAMASKTPFISSACGNAAEIVDWGGGGTIVESQPMTYGRVKVEAGVLAKEIETLLANPERRRQMAEAGYAAWRQHFTWEKLARDYEQLYLRVAQSRGKVLA